MHTVEIINIILGSIFLVIAVVVGFPCLIKSIYFFSKALDHRNLEVAKKNYFTSFNFSNALWVPNGLTLEGREYRQKALRNLVVFIGVVCLLALLDF